MKSIRKRLTFSNVIACLALFVALGGAAYAGTQLPKNSVGTKQLKKNAVTTAKIKKNAVTTAKIRNGAVTGTKIKLSSLGTVPSANHAASADTAASADSAANATTVDGNRVVNFKLNGAAPIGETQILDLNGLQLVASCSGSEEVTLVARTSINDGEIAAWANDASSGLTEKAYDDTFNVGASLTLPAPSHSDVLGEAAYTGGDLRTVRFFYSEEDSIGSNNCLLNGYAIG